MSKITFRADDDLVDRLEEFDASKSEVMRRALRSYLDGATDDEAAEPAPPESAAASDTGEIDEVIAERVDELVADRLDEYLPARAPRKPRDVNVNVTLDGVKASKTGGAPVEGRVADPAVEGDDTPERASDTDEPDVDSGKTHDAERGSTSDADGGSAQTTRNTCPQCGENIEEEDVYCPNCGGKASRRIFCECGDELRSDWAFCPSCGRRTPAADVLDRS